jgi:hypothetical protein
VAGFRHLRRYEMADTIKAIETRYKGYRFRSRLEARWAVFWDEMCIGYEYEKEGFDLGDLGYYLPDFWIPAQRAWVEIKGQAPTEGELAKCARLAERGDLVFLLYGNIGEHRGIGWAAAAEGDVLCKPFTVSLSDPSMRAAFIAARGARFDWQGKEPGIGFDYQA